MIFRQDVFECFGYGWGGDRSRHKSDADRDEGFRWEGLCCESCPEAVAISRDGGEARDSVRLDEVVDLAALDVRSAVIPHGGGCIAADGPGLRDALRQVLQIGTHVERGGGVAPNLPGCFRNAQAFEKPGLLLGAKNCLSGAVLGEIRNVDAAETD